jgi:hypothetical protein
MITFQRLGLSTATMSFSVHRCLAKVEDEAVADLGSVHDAKDVNGIHCFFSAEETTS